jgi:hypothetical protein
MSSVARAPTSPASSFTLELNLKIGELLRVVLRIMPFPTGLVAVGAMLQLDREGSEA